VDPGVKDDESPLDGRIAGAVRPGRRRAAKAPQEPVQLVLGLERSRRPRRRRTPIAAVAPEAAVTPIAAAAPVPIELDGGISAGPAERSASLRLLASLRERAVSTWRASSVYVMLLAASMAVWVAALPLVHIGRMDDSGLISVLPPLVFVAIAMLTASAAVLLRRGHPDPLLLTAHLIGLVIMLYAIPIIVEPLPRFATTYVHVGISEYISRTGTVAPGLEARFDWPGFFILASFLSQACGLGSTLDLAGWAPVYLNLLYLGPLALIARSVTRDLRFVFAAVWVFEIADWVGQDYFSPQGLNYFLFLVIIAFVLTCFRAPRSWSDRLVDRIRSSRPVRLILGRLGPDVADEELPGAGLSPRQRAGVLAYLTAIFVFVAFSHQLTPFFTLSAVLALALFNRVRLRALPILYCAITAAWISYMTGPFLSGHVSELLADIGQVNQTLSSNVGSRVTGSPTHQLIVTLCLVFTAGVLLLGVLGAVVRFRDGRRDVSLLLLLAAPAPLMALQAYGGEMIIRVFLFELPFAALLIAGLVYGRPGGIPSLFRTGLVVAGSLVIVLGFFVTRYGNERMDVMTPAEMQAADELYKFAPSGSILVSADTNLPWRYRAYEKYVCLPETDILILSDAHTLAKELRAMSNPETFVIFTASEKAYAEMFFGLSSDSWDGFVASVKVSPDFQLLYENSDAQVFRLVASPATVLAP
jgi:hypothetical protein